jgi:hypothetical protein
MYRALLAAAAACTLLTSRDGSVGQLKDVEILAVKRVCCGSGLIEFLHRVTVRTSEGRQLDLYAVSLSPKRDVLPDVGAHCDVHYVTRCTDFGDNRPVMRDFKCGVGNPGDGGSQ